MPKTGTSAIQSFCAQHFEQLKKAGIFYPREENQAFLDAEKGKISSGNGYLLAKYLRKPDCEKKQKAYLLFCKQLKSKKKTRAFVFFRSFLEFTA